MRRGNRYRIEVVRSLSKKPDQHSPVEAMVQRWVVLALRIAAAIDHIEAKAATHPAKNRVQHVLDGSAPGTAQSQVAGVVMGVAQLACISDQVDPGTLRRPHRPTNVLPQGGYVIWKEFRTSRWKVAQAQFHRRRTRGGSVNGNKRIAVGSGRLPDHGAMLPGYLHFVHVPFCP